MAPERDRVKDEARTVEDMIRDAHHVLAEHDLHASASKITRVVRRYVRERDAGETVEFTEHLIDAVAPNLGERACRVPGCPGRMRGKAKCPVCRRYPRGFNSAQRLFRDGSETARVGRRGRRIPVTTGVDEAEVERLEAAMAAAIADVRRTWRGGQR